MSQNRLLPGLIYIVFAAQILPGCTTTRVVSKYDCDTVSNNPLNTKTTWSFAWGLVEPKPITPNCDPRFNHLNQVQSKTNFGYALITVVSLGIVMPQKVTWCCAPYSPPTDSLNQRP